MSEPEDLKNCRFFEAGCKVTTSYHFIQIFRSDFEEFFLLIFTRTFEELFAFFRSGRQRYEEYFYQQIFSFTRYSHFYSLSICHLQRTCPFCHCFYPLFLSPLAPFTGASVSNRVAKIDSSTSLPNIFRSFFLPFSETRCQQGFHCQKTFTANHTPSVAHTPPVLTNASHFVNVLYRLSQKTMIILTAAPNYQ